MSCLIRIARAAFGLIVAGAAVLAIAQEHGYREHEFREHQFLDALPS